MEDNKVSVKEALDKLYDLSWMIGSTAMEYLTDKDGEKIRDYIGVIEDRINDLEGELDEVYSVRPFFVMIVCILSAPIILINAFMSDSKK